jgi:hypothetical protein
MVRKRDLTWNQIEVSLLLMHQKLQDLGFDERITLILKAAPKSPFGVTLWV